MRYPYTGAPSKAPGFAQIRAFTCHGARILGLAIQHVFCLIILSGIRLHCQLFLVMFVYTRVMYGCGVQSPAGCGTSANSHRPRLDGWGHASSFASLGKGFSVDTRDQVSLATTDQ